MRKTQYKTRWFGVITGSLLGLAIAGGLTILLGNLPRGVFAENNTPVFGPACGEASVDGEIQSLEWNNAYSMTFSTVSAGEPFTGTLYVMNGASNLYLGFTINDDELTTQGLYMGEGDSLRTDFDNDNGGSLFQADDEVLFAFAAAPQFQDGYIVNTSSSGADEDIHAGGESNGAGAVRRIGGLNHLELKHPLCSGDAKDFCLSPGEVIGFRLEYLDTEGMTLPPISHLFPGAGSTDVAEIVIGSCNSVLDNHNYLPLVAK